jgi:transcriptional regulator with XRE-family HTH domain
MKRDRLDRLLQLAYLEGRINTHGAYEKSVAKKKTAIRVSIGSRAALRRRLEAALATGVSLDKVPDTIGAFLKKCRTERPMSAREIFTRVGVPQNIYRMMEQDRISPLKISVESWRKLSKLFEVSSDFLIDMITRTHRVVFFQPSFKSTLARYRAGKTRGMKASTLENAARELYIRADLSLPQAEQDKLDAFVRALRQALQARWSGPPTSI